MNRVFLLALLVAGLWWSPSLADDKTRTYTFNGLTGGTTKSLDSLPSASLNDGDLAYGANSTHAMDYVWDADSAVAESSPDTIAADDNAGNGRWILLTARHATATTTDAGIIEIATDAETAAGSATDKAVTPGSLVSVYATDAETAAGSATDKIVTPSSLASVLRCEHVWIPAAALTPQDTGGPETITTEYAINGHTLDTLAFDGATTENATIALRMPSGWDRGTVKARFYWAPGDSAASAGDTVEWQISGVAVSDDDAIDAATGTEQVISDTVLAGVEGDLHISGASPAITIGGTPALGDLVIFTVSRNVSGTDNMTEDAWLLGIIFEFSRNQTVSAW
jgi:hypothetical protein